ncbi:ferrochelatase [Zhongshania guokunii]|uniref:Ferrochelatase n=1 Tax=Zhongshania guokunii TaxID=641783 RepID=A0ABV3U1B6_9GAMM
MKSGIVFVNLGTPTAPTPAAVRIFLKQFLSDRRVVEVPRIIWLCILYLIILPFRAPRVARAYRQIWMNDISPLRYFSQRLVDGVAKQVAERYPQQDIDFRLAMTYGQTSISVAIEELLASGCERLFFLPLFPQYSATTTAAVHDEITRVFSRYRDIPQWSWLRSYHDHPVYIDALAQTVKKHWAESGQGELLLMSFHGIPKRNVELGDPYQQHCEETAAALAKALNLNDDQWQLSYQSRLGKAEWLQPYTDKTVIALAQSGLKKIDVMCPAFAVECLETLEEIDGEVHEYFIENGGEAFRYVACLNDSESHQKLMISLSKSFIEEKNQLFS